MKTIKIKLNCKAPWEVGRGHTPHKSGAGLMGDRRLKRLKTRSARNRAALSD